jgi:hypothetical protein
VISARLVRHRPAACTRLGLETAVVSFRGEQKQDLTEAIEEQLSAAFEAAGIDAAGQGPVLEVRLTTDAALGSCGCDTPQRVSLAGARLVLDREANFC